MKLSALFFGLAFVNFAVAVHIACRPEFRAVPFVANVICLAVALLASVSTRGTPCP